MGDPEKQTRWLSVLPFCVKGSGMASAGLDAGEVYREEALAASTF